MEDSRLENKKVQFRKSRRTADYVKEIALLQREIECINSEKLALYNACSDGLISREEYISRRDSVGDNIRALSERIDLLEQQNRKHAQSLAVLSPTVEYLQDKTSSLQYNNELIAAMVKHMVVCSESRAEIVWKHGDEIGIFMPGKMEVVHGIE